MKLLVFCVVLLILSTCVIYQQKQKLDELNADLARSAEQIEKLQQELPKNASRQPVGTAQSGATSPANRPANNSWMFDSNQNSLGRAHKK